MNTLALLLLAIVPHEEPLTEHVGTFDVNHVIFEPDIHYVSQVVFLDHYERYGEVQIVDWRLLSTTGRPHRIWPTGEWELVFFDGELIRRIRARHAIESWATVDYERAEKCDFPEAARRGLIMSQDQRRGLRSK